MSEDNPLAAELMSVIQADRDAAASSSPHNERWGTLVRAGAMDSDPLVQAFARHRLQSQPSAGDVDRVARVLYACEKERSDRCDAILSVAKGKTVSVGMEPWEECWQVYHDDARHVLSALHPADRGDEVEKLRATIDRVRAAIEFIEPRSDVASREAIAKDLRDGMSLRKTATKHGTTVAIVRGVARKQEAGR